MLYYGDEDKKILNHDIAAAVDDIALHCRAILCGGFDGSWHKLEMELAGYAETVTRPHRALLDQIGIDNAITLVIVRMKAENILIDHLQNPTEENDLNRETTTDSDDDGLELEKYAAEIARLCWGKRIGIKHLSAHFKITEEDVKTIRASERYVSEIENLIFEDYGSDPNGVINWIEGYPRKTMPSRFSKRMGLTEQVVEALIERTLKKYANG